ncbi:hypothetical protein [Teredinibacter purpureus]|uniref:hypothetical protein n=1 Tax=Teredinibacter purpureus TaxID=2731756 RepID=UPI0005F77ACC|nr:hypothetical protein [Teredinibacter purpureus]
MNETVAVKRASPSWVRALTSALVIGSFWSAWAAYINADHGSAAQLNAAFAQGSVSFVITFFMTILLETLFSLCRHPYARVIIPIFGTMGIVIIVTTFAHVIMGTPEIINTMAAPCIAGTVYCSVYVFKLTRQRKTTEIL